MKICAQGWSAVFPSHKEQPGKLVVTMGDELVPNCVGLDTDIGIAYVAKPLDGYRAVDWVFGKFSVKAD